MNIYLRKNQEKITVLNSNTPNTSAPKLIKETLPYIKSHIDFHITIVEEFNTPLSQIDMSSKQNKTKKH